MADSTIPNLPAFLGTPNGTEPMETVQGGVSVEIPSQKVADLATIVTPITLAGMTSLISGSQVSVYKLYVITNSTQGRILVKGLTTTTLEAGALNLTTGASGTYVFSTDTFTPSGSGNASITPITVSDLQDLENGIGGVLSLTTLYITTDSTPYKLMCKAETVSQLSKTATIADSVYSGTVNYDLQTDTWSNGTIYDASGNIWNGTLPSATTLGAGSVRNTFGQSIATLVVGTGAFDNTFGAKLSGFTFGNNLQYVTIEAGLSGANYTASPAYDFLYNKAYPATIFRQSGINYHRYFDVANDRIVITDLATPANVTYIGGSASLDLEVNGTPNVDQTLLNLIEGINIDIADNGTGGVTITSLADRYKTSSITSNTVSNGAKTFTVDANLAYIPLQEVLIVYDPSNHMHGEVTSYSGTTLVVDVKNHTGSGTYATWVINLDGIPVDAITGAGTANEIAYFTAGQVIGSLDTATYPSLTELALVKGVTGSDIQTQINGKLNLTGGSLTGAINEAKGADIASAATTDIGAATGNYVVVTGTTTITALGTVQAGTRRIVNFSGVLILTHNGTSLILPTAANITTAAGDTATFISLSSGNWVCVNYQRASGAALVGGGSDTYVIQCSAPILANPGDSISYHIGVVPANTFSSIDARRAWKFPTAGNVTTVSMILEQVVNASNETVTLYIRNVTTATDYLVGTFTSDFGASTTLKTLFTGLSIAVNTTDDWTFKIVTPAWATNPTQWAMTQLIRVTV